jgi:uncharacterized protein (TIGR04255 family)
MNRIYKHPPIVEVLCEFQYLSENWDWTIPGLIYQEIKEKFPQKRQLNRVETDDEIKKGQFSGQLKNGIDRMQFVNHENNALIQVAPDLLVINHLHPYPNWKNFRLLIMENFEIYKNIAKPQNLKSIDLRYINRFEIPKKPLQMSDYFNVEPRVPEKQQPMKSLFMRVEIPHTSDSGQLMLTFGSIEEEKNEESVFVLDLEYSTLPESPINSMDINLWIDNAHQHIETLFEACITDKLRTMFMEGKS